MPESGCERPAVRSSGLAGAFACALIACTAVALWIVWPAFSPGRIVNLDAPRHLLRAVVMATQFLPAGHVDGWSPWWYLGAQLFLFQSYGYFFLIGAAALLLQHFVVLEHVFKVFFVLPVVALPAATAWMARRLGVTPLGALVAALASLVFSSPLGYGVQGVFGIGLLLQGAGILGFALAWPETLDVLLRRDRAPWRAALLVGALLLCHFITGAYTLAAAGCVAAGLALYTRELRPLLRYVLFAALVLLLAAHSLFPTLELRELAGQPVGWGIDRDRFDRFLDGTLFGVPEVAIPAMLAAAWCVVRGSRPLAISALVFFGTALLGGANAQSWEPPWLAKVLQVMARPRALPYAALFQAVFAGVAVDLALRGVTQLARALQRERWALLAPPVVLAAFLLVGLPELASQRRFVRTESMLNETNRGVYLRLVEWLRGNVLPPAIVAVPRTLFPSGTLGSRSVISLLNLDTGLYTLGGDQAELSQSSSQVGRVDLDRVHEHPSRNAAVLRAAGVSHLIVSRPDVRRALAGNADYRLEFEYDNAPDPKAGKAKVPLGVAVYRIRGGGRWLRGPGLEVRGMEHSPERISWTLAPGKGDAPRAAIAAVNWHPNWAAFVDGVRVPTRRSTARRVAFDVAPAASRVTLEFERTTGETLWNALSIATLLFVVAASRCDARRRRPDRRDDLRVDDLLDDPGDDHAANPNLALRRDLP